MTTGTFMNSIFKNNIFSDIAKLLGGTPEQIQQVPRFTQPQQDIFSQLQTGAAGALPAGFEHILAMLTQDPEAAKQFEAPAMRQFHQEIIPSIAQRFTSQFGTGSKSSSGFRQAMAAAGAGLSEDLQLQRGERSDKAFQQMLQLVGGALTPQHESIIRPRQPGLVETGLGGILENLPGLLAMLRGKK